jgi:hypothetical protein
MHADLRAGAFDPSPPLLPPQDDSHYFHATSGQQ